VYQNQILLSSEEGLPMSGEFYTTVDQKGSYLIGVSDSQGETTWVEINADIATETERVYGIF
jgi:hypothetical protein